MKYIITYTTDESWETTSSLLVETDDRDSMEHHLRLVLQKWGETPEVADVVVSNKWYYILQEQGNTLNFQQILREEFGEE